MNRKKVVDFDVTVEIDQVKIHPGDLVIADRDGVVFVPKDVEQETLRRAWRKVHGENRVREEIRKCMKASEAWERFGIL